MRWGEPDILLWIIALIPLLFICNLMLRRRMKCLQKMASKTLWGTLMANYSFKRQRIKILLRLLAIGLTIIALARPQWGFHWEEVKQRGLNILVTLDTSKSMLAQDIKPNRLQQAKWGIHDLVQKLNGDRIGLIAFAGEAFLQCPATIDYAAFMMMLNDTYAGIIPLGGTDLYEALKTSIESFDPETAADKVIVLISDGEGHSGDPLSLIPKLKKENIRLFAIGVGTLEGDLIQTSDGFVKDEKGNVIKSTLNETMLSKMAIESGGFYIRSAPGDFGLERVYEQGIARLQREDRESRMNKAWQEHFPWFLAAALLILILEATIRPTKSARNLNKTPKRADASIILLLMTLALFSTNSLAVAEETPRSAMRKGLKMYRQGNYTNAISMLEKTAIEFPSIGNYNLGNAHFRLGDYEAAEKAYEEALRSEDINFQAAAYFNRGNALLARTTALNSPEQIKLAAELCFNAQQMYEKSLLLKPNDFDAKKNYEKAYNLRWDLEHNQGKWLYDQAEQKLAEFKAKEAKQLYEAAKKQFEHILEGVDPDSNKAKQYIPNIVQRLDMLQQAVEKTKDDLRIALLYIEDYQYKLAAERLMNDSDERKYAFDLDSNLKSNYEKTIEKNSEVLKIIEELSTLNQ